MMSGQEDAGNKEYAESFSGQGRDLDSMKMQGSHSVTQNRMV